MKDKIIALRKLYDASRTCSPCVFGKTEENHKVFGEGNPNAKILFIGEAPGAEEDAQKRPFVGKAGKLLNKYFEQAGFSRSDVYITNIAKCRPPNNRTPLPSEISREMQELLLNEITIIKPKVICTLGKTAVQAILNRELTMGAVRGKKFSKNGITLIPLYHPAYILHNPPAGKILLEDLKEAFRLA